MADVDLYRTAKSRMLHIPGCHHVNGIDLVLASEEECLAAEVCSACQKSLDGKGRTYHETIEEALEDLGAPGLLRAELARLLREAPHDQIWVNHARTYVAVATQGEIEARSGMYYVKYRDGRIVELPGFVGSDGGGPAKAEEQWGETCPECFMARSMSGHCLCA